MKVWPWLAALGIGVVLGAGGLRWFEAVTTDVALEKQKAELVRLTTELRQKEAALTASQARVEGQAARLHEGLTDATRLASQVSQTQGSAVERLKAVVAALRKLEAELGAEGSSAGK